MASGLGSVPTVTNLTRGCARARAASRTCLGREPPDVHDWPDGRADTGACGH
jgi:hypothetical protein